MCNLLPPYLSLLVQKRRGWWMCGICLMKKGFFFWGGGVGLLDCGAFLFEVSRKDGDQGRRR